ncbi:hypothetical protein GCM10009555_034860 [Acrocarpospora macrocephala]|uniref:EfeO-type cupredoxin-like domain-containing protein n=1 Tax=Acrocarpospora macrocephala TaxID=150177 RepID=A0A5M3WC80_9ACTN|nr:hypothetical protein [Acrocarpospora macrocephala]GES06667.1 hypothetical protein Amac_002620 [Acrocarpospora macrocephala]
MRKLWVIGTALAVATACSATPAPGATTTVAPTPDPANTAAAFGHEVRITSTGAVPKLLVSGVGEEVAWRNDSGAEVTVRLIDGTPPSGTLKPGDVFSHTFTTAGTFAYMLGTEKDPAGAVEVLPHEPAS